MREDFILILAMATIFTQIIRGQIPCYKVGEDADNFAFLDINPLVEGHTLVVTKLECDYIFDLPEKRISSLMLFAGRVARNIKAATGCKRVAVIVLGLDVPHVHIHLVPMNTMDDVDFSREKLSLSPDQFVRIASMIAL